MTHSDNFTGLDALRLSHAAVAMTKPKPSTRRSRRRVAGEFYLCPVGWADRAAAVVTSKEQFVLALRLYRRWLTRRPEASTITASNTALAGVGFSRNTKRRMQQNLQRAGLIEIVEQHPGRAPCLRVIEIC
jgi:hypothetical protein